MNRDRIPQGRAALSGIAILLYFAVFTAWMPSILARSAFLATASRNVADLVIIIVWGGFFALGIVALRWTQDRGLI
jgi:ABC-type Mn2+/Zn2+ transport system permease subunit